MTDTPRHGHAPIQMRKVAGYSALERPGDFYRGADREEGDEGGARDLWIALPVHNPKREGQWTVVHIPADRWTVSGTDEAPDVMPSIHTIGIWHGWARNGQLVEA